MERTQSPIWKSALKGIGWFFGILAYDAEVTFLIVYVFGLWAVTMPPILLPIMRFLNNVVGYPPAGYLSAVGVLWAALLAVPVWRLFVHRHRKAAGLQTVLVVLLLLLYAFWIWASFFVPNPVPPGMPIIR